MPSKSRAALSKRTKDSLIDEMEELRAKLKDTVAPDPTSAAVAREATSKARDAVKGLSIDGIVQKGGAFGLELQRTVAGLVEQTVQQAGVLESIQTAIAAETEELERLYQLDVASASIAALIDDYTKQRADLETQQLQARKTWGEEVTEHNKTVAQRNKDIETQRAREQQEYEYRTNQQRARAEEEFKYRLQIAQRNENERIDQAQKILSERAEALTARETENEVLRARVAGLDGEIKAAAEKAVSIATNSLKKELTSQFAIERLEAQNQITLAQQRSAAMADSNNKLAAEVAKLHEQLAQAKQQVTDITLKALEASSGQQALQNMKDFVKDAAPVRNGSKS